MMIFGMTLVVLAITFAETPFFIVAVSISFVPKRNHPFN